MNLGRYQCETIGHLFSEQTKIKRWAQVEIAALFAQGTEFGEAPADAWLELANTPKPTPEQVAQHEAVTRHDVAAFVDAWTANSDSPVVARWLHYGLTSSDVVDTGQAILVRDATHHAAQQIKQVRSLLAAHALEHWYTPRIGRTHGQAAEPTRWGIRVSEFAFAVDRALVNITDAADRAAVVHVSGPMGNYAHVSREVELEVASWLELAAPKEVASQVVMRDRLADWAWSLAVFATISEAFALEIRHLARTEVSEAAEGTTTGQKGSSSMPHKRNPVTAEKICGLAKVARSSVMPLLEGVALWHERDISHSSVERVLLEQLVTTVDHIAHGMVALIENLVVFPARMEANITTQGSATLVNELIQDGEDRAGAYEWARNNYRQTPCAPARADHVLNDLRSLV